MNMPGLYERLFRNVLFPAYDGVVRGRGTLRFLGEYERSQWLAPEQIAEIRWRKLKRLLDHCWQEVPYYRKQWRSLGLQPGDIRTPEDFARLPVLTKHDVREHFEALKADNWRDRLFYKSTSGSTGEPFRFGYTRESNDRRFAVMWRGYGWAGSRMGRRTLYLWAGAASGASLAAAKQRLYARVYNRLTLNSFEMTEGTMAQYADAIDRWRPEIIVSYVGPLVQLAEWLLASGRKVHRPVSILGAAEALHDFQRDIVERAFGCPAYNTYGCREFMLIASECEQRNGLHINADHLFVEVSNPVSMSRRDGTGELVITDLHNEGMPFIRYVTGDLATPATRLCSCGRGLPLLERVEGRKLDAIRTPDGHLLPGEFFPFMLNDMAWIKRFQIVQRTLDSVDVTLAVDDGVDASMIARVKALIGKALGDRVDIRMHVVADLPVAANGKFRVTISELAS
jgi:phenylacetate-CoA ligase